MRRSGFLNTQAPVTGKITRLYQLLVSEKLAFEQVAGSITDHALRCTILSLAQQNNQYAAELSSYMQSTGTAGAGLTGKKHGAKPRREEGRGIYPDESRILAFCNSNERKLVTAYRKLLLESALYEGLKKMMGYQLNGILSACMQLKLLISLNKGYHQKHLQGI